MQLNVSVASYHEAYKKANRLGQSEFQSLCQLGGEVSSLQGREALYEEYTNEYDPKKAQSALRSLGAIPLVILDTIKEFAKTLFYSYQLFYSGADANSLYLHFYSTGRCLESIWGRLILLVDRAYGSYLIEKAEFHTFLYQLACLPMSERQRLLDSTGAAYPQSLERAQSGSGVLPSDLPVEPLLEKRGSVELTSSREVIPVDPDAELKQQTLNKILERLRDPLEGEELRKRLLRIRPTESESSVNMDLTVVQYGNLNLQEWWTLSQSTLATGIQQLPAILLPFLTEKQKKQLPSRSLSEEQFTYLFEKEEFFIPEERNALLSDKIYESNGSNGRRWITAALMPWLANQMVGEGEGAWNVRNIQKFFITSDQSTIVARAFSHGSNRTGLDLSKALFAALRSSPHFSEIASKLEIDSLLKLLTPEMISPLAPIIADWSVKKIKQLLDTLTPEQISPMAGELLLTMAPKIVKWGDDNLSLFFHEQEEARSSQFLFLLHSSEHFPKIVERLYQDRQSRRLLRNLANPELMAHLGQLISNWSVEEISDFFHHINHNGSMVSTVVTDGDIARFAGLKNSPSFRLIADKLKNKGRGMAQLRQLMTSEMMPLLQMEKDEWNSEKIADFFSLGNKDNKLIDWKKQMMNGLKLSDHFNEINNKVNALKSTYPKKVMEWNTLSSS